MNPLDRNLKDHLDAGTVIPAHPLVLTENRKIDEFRQKRLTKYYIASGAGGLAIGVHTTQFRIRDPQFDLYEKVLGITSEAIRESKIQRPFLKIAGVSGKNEEALEEARLAANLGYDLALLNMNGLGDLSERELIRRAQILSEEIPLFGFYLQPAVGGRILSFDYWKELASLPNLHAIKVAPFNRYQTLDVIRAVCHSERHEEIALYTGNDDNIIADLLTDYLFTVNGEKRKKSIVGGLLGHWAFWTSRAVQLLDEIKHIRSKDRIPDEILTRGIAITDANAAVFDALNNFKGCIPGIHEVLRRQGLLKGIWCLDPEEQLSPGQSDEITRVYRDYPELNDDEFVRKFLKAY